MRAAANHPIDFRVVLHDHLSNSYEVSQVLLATAGLDGTLQLLTSAWEAVLGYRREEFKGKTLSELMWFNARSAAAAVAAILNTLHRLYGKREQMMYIVAVEAPARRHAGSSAERRAFAREA